MPHGRGAALDEDQRTILGQLRGLVSVPLCLATTAHRFQTAFDGLRNAVVRADRYQRIIELLDIFDGRRALPGEEQGTLTYQLRNGRSMRLNIRDLLEFDRLSSEQGAIPGFTIRQLLNQLTQCTNLPERQALSQYTTLIGALEGRLLSLIPAYFGAVVTLRLEELRGPPNAIRTEVGRFQIGRASCRERV